MYAEHFDGGGPGKQPVTPKVQVVANIFHSISFRLFDLVSRGPERANPARFEIYVEKDGALTVIVHSCFIGPRPRDLQLRDRLAIAWQFIKGGE